ncbi:MAG TPA: hypothetical protein VEQ58_00840, partial [Polyangiaceae bacterium]|nr:hypothetical protein [Polyangiaceae bacterium]
GGAAPLGAHCMPGTPQAPEHYLGLELGSCPSVSGLEGDFISLFDIQPSAPVGPGQVFAFSAYFAAPSAGDFELYGAKRRCGDAEEKLGSVRIGSEGTVCFDVKPQTDTYSHLIWVWRNVANMKELALCDAGMCPVR